MRIPNPLCLLLPLVAACLVVLPSCSELKQATHKETKFQMGQPVALGSLTYTAIETEWKDSVQTPTGTRMPAHRFLLIKVTVTNGGGSEVTVPLLSLVDAKGQTYLEEDKGDGVPQWLGLLRILKPAQTDEGFLLFDVPQASYRLRVTTGGDPEKELSALVEIPFQLDAIKPSGELPITPQQR